MNKAHEIIAQMKVWFDGSTKNRPDFRADEVLSRSDEQKAWDSAILAAAEFVRRLDDYDESRAILILELLSTNLPKGVTNDANN